jgi:hypothetical protein
MFLGRPSLELFTVMVGIPMCLNVGQAWIQDQVRPVGRGQARGQRCELVQQVSCCPDAWADAACSAERASPRRVPRHDATCLRASWADVCTVVNGGGQVLKWTARRRIRRGSNGGLDAGGGDASTPLLQHGGGPGAAGGAAGSGSGSAGGVERGAAGSSGEQVRLLRCPCQCLMLEASRVRGDSEEVVERGSPRAAGACCPCACSASHRHLEAPSDGGAVHKAGMAIVVNNP